MLAVITEYKMIYAGVECQIFALLILLSMSYFIMIIVISNRDGYALTILPEPRIQIFWN